MKSLNMSTNIKKEEKDYNKERREEENENAGDE